MRRWIIERIARFFARRYSDRFADLVHAEQERVIREAKARAAVHRIDEATRAKRQALGLDWLECRVCGLRRASVRAPHNRCAWCQGQAEHVG